MPGGLLLWVVLAVMVVGLIGSVVPGIPGVTLIFLAAGVYAFLNDFVEVSGWIVALLGLFAALAIVADYLVTAYGARRFGASWAGTVGGAVGGLAGVIAGLPLPGVGSILGLILGSIIGVFVGEYLHRRRKSPESERTDRGDWRRTSRAAGGVLVGYVASAIVQGILAVASVAAFVLALIY